MASSPKLTHAVKVTLTHARELEAADYNGASDPYVLLTLDDGQSARSSCRLKTLDPVWNPPEHFDFKVCDPEQRSLLVEVYDHDLLTADDLIGSKRVSLKDFMSAIESDAHTAGDRAPTSPSAAKSVAFALEAPASVKTGAANQVFLRIAVTPLEMAEVRLEIWENECWMLGTGWSSNEKYLVDHRRRFSTEDGEVSADSIAEVAPKPPLGYEAVTGWTFSVGKGDREGWLYAATFVGPWYPEKLSSSYVRRRKWERVCRRSKSLRSPTSHQRASSNASVMPL
ncbi:C2 domain-containing protein [Globisporangium polare]